MLLLLRLRLLPLVPQYPLAIVVAVAVAAAAAAAVGLVAQAKEEDLLRRLGVPPTWSIVSFFLYVEPLSPNCSNQEVR